MNFNKMINRKGTYCTQWDYVEDRFGRSDLLPFTISDSDFSLPEEVLDALQQRIQHGVFGYSRWNHDDFKSSVYNWYKKRFESQIDTDWVTYSPSVIYSISQLLNLKSEEGNGVIIQTPAYDAFYKTITANHRLVVENPLKFDGKSYEIDFELLEDELKKDNNKVLLFCSPHNPTGRVWSSDDVKRVVKLCHENDVFIISDEIHMDILRPDFQHYPITNFDCDNVALLTSGTKTFNFPSLLFSYLLIPDNQLREDFLVRLKSKDGLSSPSVLGMLATMESYNKCEPWLTEMNDYIDENIKYTREFLEDNCSNLSLVNPEATYLLWINCSELNVSMDKFQEVLINDAKVAIMDGRVYGGNGKNFLRLNVGCPKSKLQEGLNRLKMAYDIVSTE